MSTLTDFGLHLDLEESLGAPWGSIWWPQETPTWFMCDHVYVIFTTPLGFWDPFAEQFGLDLETVPCLMCSKARFCHGDVCVSISYRCTKILLGRLYVAETL